MAVSCDYECLFPSKDGQITSVVFQTGTDAHPNPCASLLHD